MHHFEFNRPQESRRFLVIPQLRILLYIGVATLIAWSAWTLVLFKLDPYNSPDLALPLFFLTTFVALSGSFSMILFALKRWRLQDDIYVRHTFVSLRQGLLLSLCTFSCLGLLMVGYLRIWNGLLLVLLMMLIEFYFSQNDEN